MQQALSLGLVDEIRVHVIPVLLGGGTALFGRLDSAIAALTPTAYPTGRGPPRAAAERQCQLLTDQAAHPIGYATKANRVLSGDQLFTLIVP